MIFHSKSEKDTAKFADLILKKALRKIKKNDVFVIGLVGDLGAGKTSFTKAFLKKLGVKNKVTSPTFTIMRHYEYGDTNVYHIDAYRIEYPDMLNLGFKKLIKEKGSIVIVEWALRIKKIMPRKTFWIKIEHGKKKNERKFIYN